MIARDIVLQTENSIDVEPGAATLYDLSRYRNNGTINNATWAQLPSGLWVLNFDGTGDYVTIPDHASLDLTDAITMEAWLYMVGAGGGFGHIFAKGNPQSPTFRFNDVNNLLQVLLENGAGIQAVTSGNNVITPLTWHYVVFTWSDADDTVRIYVDAVEVFNGVVAGPLVPNNNVMSIGATSIPTEEMTGMLAFIREYSYVRTVGQIYQRYEATKHWLGVHD